MGMMRSTFRPLGGLPWWYWRRLADRRDRIAGGAGATMEVAFSASAIAEDAVIGTVAAALTVTNLPGGVTVSSWAITADPDSKFAIDGADLDTAAALDYEAKTTHSVTVEATLSDASTVSGTQVFDVTNVYEAANLNALTLDTSTVEEGTAQGVLVGTLQSVTGGSTLSLTDTAGGRFQLDGNTIETGATATDYDIAQSHQVTVRETLADSANSPRDTNLTITVTEVTLGAAAALLAAETDGLAFSYDQGSLSAAVKASGTVTFDGDPNDLLTYTAPSAKWLLNASGVLASGSTLRMNYDAAGVALGLLVEGARTNLCLHSDDLTQAAWTKTNCTAAKTATGVDDVANSASTLTATADNATVLQSITSASNERMTSCYIKRRTGTGGVDITQDNGATWTAVTVTSSWTRVYTPLATTTNPVVGLRLATNGDAVDVQFFQQEVTGATGWSSSPIRTTTASVARAVDNISLLATLFPWSATAGTALFHAYPIAIGSGGQWAFSDGTTANYIQGAAAVSVHLAVTVSNVAQAAIDAGTWTQQMAAKAATAWAANDFAASIEGGAAATDSAGTLPTITKLWFGTTQGSVNGIRPTIHKEFVYLPRRMANADLVTWSGA